MAVHDLVIRGGLVVDGSGGPPHRGDVAVDGDRITAVTGGPGHGRGGDGVGRGRREIDAAGLAVLPGFVDIHTHYDGQATWDPDVTPSSWHGVTTVVMGNCGVGFAPADPERRDWLVGLMEGVEDIPGTALVEGITWGWETFPEYLDELARLPRVLDVSAMVPHGAVRAYVMGDRGAANEPATPDDIAAMAAVVRDALRAGAVGLSTTRTVLHRARGGELAAGTTAAADEVQGLGAALADAGGRRVMQVTSDFVDPDAELAWMAAVAGATGCPVTFACSPDHQRPDLWRRLMDAAAAGTRGVQLVPQVGGRPTSVLFGLTSSANPFMLHAAWAELAELPPDERAARMRRPEVRRAFLAERPDDAGVASFLADAWGRIFPLGDPPDYEPPAERSVAALARRQGRSPEEVTYDLLLERDGRALLYMPLDGYATGDLSVLHTQLTAPGAVLGLGDAGAHCGMLCDAGVPTYLLAHWVRDRSRGPRLPLELAVNLLSRRNAELFGFVDRGLVRPGQLADLNVVDLDRLAVEAPEVVADLPAGGRRVLQAARGYVATVKRGAVVREDDRPTGARPGRLVRGSRAPA